MTNSLVLQVVKILSLGGFGPNFGLCQDGFHFEFQGFDGKEDGIVMIPTDGFDEDFDGIPGEWNVIEAPEDLLGRIAKKNDKETSKGSTGTSESSNTNTGSTGSSVSGGSSSNTKSSSSGGADGATQNAGSAKKGGSSGDSAGSSGDSSKSDAKKALRGSMGRSAITGRPRSPFSFFPFPLENVVRGNHFPENIILDENMIPGEDENMIPGDGLIPGGSMVVENGVGPEAVEVINTNTIDMNDFMELFPVQPSFFPLNAKGGSGTVPMTVISDDGTESDMQAPLGADVMLHSMLKMMSHVIHPEHFVGQLQKAYRTDGSKNNHPAATGSTVSSSKGSSSSDNKLLDSSKSISSDSRDAVPTMASATILSDGEVVDPCKDDVDKFCDPNTNQKLHCLGQHASEIDIGCKTNIEKSVPFACSQKIIEFGCDDKHQGDDTSQPKSLISCLKLHQRELDSACRNAVVRTVSTIQKFRQSKTASLISPTNQVLASSRNTLADLHPYAVAAVKWEVYIVIGLLFLAAISLLVYPRVIRKRDNGIELTDPASYGAFAL